VGGCSTVYLAEASFLLVARAEHALKELELLVVDLCRLILEHYVVHPLLGLLAVGVGRPRSG
jgi:hypothetical protein